MPRVAAQTEVFEIDRVSSMLEEAMEATCG